MIEAHILRIWNTDFEEIFQFVTKLYQEYGLFFAGLSIKYKLLW